MKLVVLNACFSEAVAVALTGVVDCVVGMRGAIGDGAARAFAVGFYSALGYGRSVGNAVAQAIAALSALGLPDRMLPICVTRHGLHASDVFLPPQEITLPPVRATSSVSPSADEAGSYGASRAYLRAAVGSTHQLTDEELLQATLVHYPASARATRDFKEVICERLIGWIGNHVFHTFVPDDSWRTRLKRYSAESDMYVSIALPGHFETEACKLEIGLWWRPDRGGKANVYVGLDAPWGRKIRPTRSQTRRDVHATAYLLQDAASADPDTLLDELEGAARVARTS